MTEGMDHQPGDDSQRHPTETPAPQSTETKKPIYKRWWFIGGISLSLIIFIGIIYSGSNTESQNESSQTATASGKTPHLGVCEYLNAEKPDSVKNIYNPQWETRLLATVRDDCGEHLQEYHAITSAIVCDYLQSGRNDSVKELHEAKSISGNQGLLLDAVQSTCQERLVQYQEAVAPPPPPAPPTKEQFAAIGERDFALLVKNPDAYTGDLYVIYGQITQFDAATGTTAFLANVTGPLPDKDYWGNYEFWQDGENSIVTGSEGLLAGVVKDDQLKMWVEVDGSFSYDTQVGGNTTVPMFKVHHMDIIGRDS